MKLNFNMYILLVIICIGMVFPYSNKKNFHYQALLHFITGIFLYLMLTPKHDHKHTPVQNTHKSSKELTEDDLECLKKKACDLSATKNECNSYVRCKWNDDDKTCTRKTDCKETEKYACLHSDYCIWNVDGGVNGEGSCSYKTIPGKIFNEDAKANKYCFKKNPEFIEIEANKKNLEKLQKEIEANKKNPEKLQNSLGEYVEDKDYVTCKEECEKDNIECINKCIIKAINRLSCNTVKGMKYENTNGICRKDRNYIPPKKTHNPKCLKVAQHSHDNPDEPDYIPPHAPGYRTSHNFKINDDRRLRFILNSFIILIIILINIGIIKLFKN